MSLRPSSAPDRWLLLEVPKPRDEELASLVVEELIELAERGVEEREDAFVVYLPALGRDGEGEARALQERLLGVHGLDLAVTFGWQEHTEWGEVWRRGFSCRRITARLVVCPSWEDPDLKPGETLLLLDPGMAFGTAEHATTRSSLRLLDSRVRPGDRIADIGAGSGILSIAAALLGADRVIAVEMDGWSCIAARENVERNGVSDRVEIREGIVGADFLPGEPPFDGILANIECGVLLPLLPGFRSGLREGGWIVLSGILAQEVDSVLERTTASGLHLDGEELEDGWWSGAFRERNERSQSPSEGSGLSAQPSGHPPAN